MAAITGKRLWRLARHGEPQLLLDALRYNAERGFDLTLKPDFALSLADLIEDAIARKLDRPVKRAKWSTETKAIVDSERYRSAIIVVRQIRAMERKLGKQLRGKARADAIADIAKRLKPPHNQVTVAAVNEYIKRGSPLSPR